MIWPYPCGCTLQQHVASSSICAGFPECDFGRSGTPASRLIKAGLEGGRLRRTEGRNTLEASP